MLAPALTMRARVLVIVAMAAASGWPVAVSGEIRGANPVASRPHTQAASPQAASAQPLRLPPADSPPLVRYIQIAFPRQGDVSVIDPQTYLYYLQTQASRSSDGVWVPYHEQTVLEDFRRLWNTNFLEDLWIDVKDVPYENGVIGKHIIFNMEERQRVKIVDYVGSKKLEQTKIDEKLKEAGVQIRLDSFIDPGLVRRVKDIVREMLAEKGYQFAKVTHEIKEMAGGPKLVHLTFTMEEGPKVKIRDIEFVGNQAVSDRALKRRMKENKEQWFLSFITGRGTYQEAKFEEDADKVVEYYRDKGYVSARVGQPELKFLDDARDGKTRWVQLRVPVTEGRRYRVGAFTFDGNTVVKAEALRPLFALKAGAYYSEKRVRKGLEKAKELYGSGGYFEFTAYPDLKPQDERPPAAAEAGRPSGGGRGRPSAPLVDVTMRVQEGKQYFVNRITFVGNTNTRDNVIRREMRLVENGVFNTEALKHSVRRLNQLGYFKPLEGQKDIVVDKTPGVDSKVDVTLKFAEQNRNQLTFGAGVSQFEGFFGQLAFQTANFMGRGETFSVSLQAGSRAQNYQVAFTEPFLFDRPITGGVDLFKREIRYINEFTQKTAGGNVVVGFPAADFTRMFVNYSLERVKVTDLNELLLNPVLANNPFYRDSFLIGEGGKRTISKVVPSLVHNTVDNPIFPTSGRRYTASIDLAGVGGNTNFYKPRVETIWYFQQSRRTSIGFRAQVEYVAPFTGTKELPIFEKLFLGGEYSIRGYDIRTVGPRDPETDFVIGGNKSLLFNGEYLISIAGPVRLVLYYDAGQALGRGRRFALDEFKTSTGAEIRFFMPVLNVPFRLIFAYNANREGVLDNTRQPEKKFRFRFAVGSTF